MFFRVQLREAVFAFQEQDTDYRHELELLEEELLESKKNELRYYLTHLCNVMS